MAETDIAVKQNIRYKNTEDAWVWANPITIYKNGTVKLNGSLTETIDTATLLKDYSITSVKMFGNGQGQDADTIENNEQRPVTTNTIQKQAITTEKIANGAIRHEHLYGSSANEEDDELKPITGANIRNNSISGDQVASDSIPLWSLSKAMQVKNHETGEITTETWAPLTQLNSESEEGKKDFCLTIPTFGTLT